MKTKILTMLAMMFVSMGALAQSNEPLEGDVNNDGTVDVADSVSILKIMMNGGGVVGEKICYWYAGTNNGNAVTADNFADVASRIAESEVPETGSVTANGQYVYFVMPEAKHLGALVDGNGSAVELTCTDVMGYKIYKTAGMINGMLNYTVEQSIYHWYVGQNSSDTYITSSNYQTIATQNEFETKTINMIEGNYLYVVVPSNKSVDITDRGNNGVTINYFNPSTATYGRQQNIVTDDYYLIRTRTTAGFAEAWTITLQ